MDSHVRSLNHVEWSALIFDTRFTAEAERHRNDLKTVQRPARAAFVRDIPTVLGGAKVQRQAPRERLTPDRP